jgi:hypothetical protein
VKSRVQSARLREDKRAAIANAENIKIREFLAKLSPALQKIAAEQQFCPITRNRLGAMGTPVAVELKGQTILLCCEGCEDRARDNPQRTLDRLKELKSRARSAGGQEGQR